MESVGAHEAKAARTWLDSDEGQRCTHGMPRGEYLRNRLWRAFNAGFDAGREYTQTEISERFAKLMCGS
jgi:hypothetical protein